MKFCQLIASLCPHTHTNFGRFNLLFNKMALIFSRSTDRFYRFKFRVLASRIALTFITDDKWLAPQLTQGQSTGLSGLRAMLESYHKLQHKPTRNSSGDEIANVNFLYDDIVHALQNTIDSCINSATDRRGGYVL